MTVPQVLPSGTWQRREDGTWVRIAEAAQVGVAGGDGGIIEVDADDRYVNADGDVMTGNLTVRATNPYVTIDTDTGGGGILEFGTAGKARWRWHKDGANADRLVLNRYDDDGAWVAIVLDLNRDTGVVNVRAPAIGGVINYLNDSGWRDAKSGLSNGWTATTCHIRRCGNEVKLYVSALNAASSTSTLFFSVPSGFAAAGGPAEVRGVLNNSTGSVFRATSGNIHVVGKQSSDVLYGTLSWFTTSAWPTSYPGGAV